MSKIIIIAWKKEKRKNEYIKGKNVKIDNGIQFLNEKLIDSGFSNFFDGSNAK